MMNYKNKRFKNYLDAKIDQYSVQTFHSPNISFFIHNFKSQFIVSIFISIN
jgi:hypothetical protein